MNICVTVKNEEYLDRARALADHLGCEAVSGPGAGGLTLVIDERGLTLTDGATELRGDFGRLMKRAAAGNLNRELLIRAVKRELRFSGGVPAAIDATAGLGEDSFLLAAAGFKVRLYEHNLIVAALLEDALERARDDTDTADLAGIARRMEVVEGDSGKELRNLTFIPDVILLDPMFPVKKRGGKTKKKLTLLRTLEMTAGDGEALLDAAIFANPGKIVIKRPLKGPYLGGVLPDYSIFGKLIRYDCLTGNRKKQLF